MGYLIGEIFICLILAALIGAVIAWLLRGVRCRSRENTLSAELDQTRTALDTAEANGRALEGSLSDLRAEMTSQTGKLQARISELEPLQRKVQERETAISQLETDFQTLQEENKSQIAKLQETIAELKPLQTQLESSQNESARLNTELQTVAHQKDQEISNLKNEIAELAYMREEMKERDTTIERLESQLRTQTTTKDGEIARLQTLRQKQEKEIRDITAEFAELAPLKATVLERQNEISHLQKELQTLSRSKQEKIDGLQRSLKDHEASIQHLNARLKAATQNQAELKRLRQQSSELSALRDKLKQRDATIADLRKQLAAGRRRAKPAAVPKRAVRRPRKKQLYTPPKEKDDLKRIFGIGPVMEKTLNKLGVTSFQQIARFTRKDIERVAKALQSFPDRIVRDDWVGGAKREYRKKYGKVI
jgi:predicted flap endonuclease-1-like 5' DNA nuclease/archaellum component FlaC